MNRRAQQLDIYRAFPIFPKVGTEKWRHRLVIVSEYVNAGILIKKCPMSVLMEITGRS
ncbi:MAG: hypothetical protein R3C26_10345 [Calditrichia bacterium]